MVNSKKRMVNAKLAYSLPELVKMSSICRGKVYEALNDGSLVGRKCGQRTIVLRADALAWLKALPMYKPEAKADVLVPSGE